ncbi:hypothetical protein TL16_g09842, partial [Triparma laevis f. inornata]
MAGPRPVETSMRTCNVGGLEDSGAHEDSVHAELHHEGGVGGGGNASGGEVHDGKLSSLSDLLHEVVRSLHLLGGDEELIIGHNREVLNLAHDGAGVPDSLDDVSSSGLSLGSEHGASLGDAAEGLSEISAAANEGDGELVLINMVNLISHSQNLTLINIINLQSLQNLRLNEVPDTSLGHDGDGDGVFDLSDHDRV